MSSLTTERSRIYMEHSRKSRLRRYGLLPVFLVFILILGIVVYMTQRNSIELRSILDSSIESRLISTSMAALEIIDVDAFDSYKSIDDIRNDADAYARTLARLRNIQVATKAKYIYALKQLDDGKYYFVFDTDPEDEAVLEDSGPYELENVLKQAFSGNQSVDMNMSDDWGNYHTGAVPIYKNGKVIGIICTDIDNTLWMQINAAAHSNILYLLMSIGVTMLVVLLLTSILLRKLQAAQDKLFRMANFDIITGIPNRQYLMSYLENISAGNGNKTKEPFALLFIDLDNFKSVNDNAGHDAGDTLLRLIAAYLDAAHENSAAFRPSAGMLNVSARVGGDEFVQVFPGVATETDAAVIARKIIENFASPALARYIEKYQVGLSVGVALYPRHSDDYNVLIKYADIAMYHAKHTGKNSYRIYEDGMYRGE